jgi:hypothetical protein
MVGKRGGAGAASGKTRADSGVWLPFHRCAQARDSLFTLMWNGFLGCRIDCPVDRGRFHALATRSSAKPISSRHPLCDRRPRWAPGTSSYPIAVSGISRRQAPGAATRSARSGALAGSAAAAPRRLKLIFAATGTERILECWRANAGWRAPQPPTPHPSGDRPWPFGRRGLLFCVESIEKIGRTRGTQVSPTRLHAWRVTPNWAGVGAGLADLSFGRNPALLNLCGPLITKS